MTLLEAHRDFDRDFRGDAIHPGTLEVLDQIGLAARLHELPRVKAKSFRFVSGTKIDEAAVFSRLPTPFAHVDQHDEAAIDVGPRQVIAVLGRPQERQLGYVDPPGRYKQVKAAGIEAFRDSIVAMLPWLGDRISLLRGWDDVSLLSVEANRLTR